MKQRDSIAQQYVKAHEKLIRFLDSIRKLPSKHSIQTCGHDCDVCMFDIGYTISLSKTTASNTYTHTAGPVSGSNKTSATTAEVLEFC